MNDIMKFSSVSKRFSDVQALDDICFSIPENTIFGLLGPNGAGKTTLIRIITKIFAADSGEIIFDGQNIKQQQYANIGYMPEEKGMYKKMKVGEQLIYLGQLKGLSKANAKEQSEFWLNKLGAGNWWNKKLEDLSKGMQQKAQFIATVIHRPKLLILDEPFSGLDPVNAELIKNEIYQLHKEGTTIIFSTHRMEQVEEICNNIALINKGKLILSGEVAGIKQSHKEHLFKVAFNSTPIINENQLFDIINMSENTIELKLKKPQTNNELLKYLIENGNTITAYYEILPTLNNIFINLVNKAQNE
jgi:ABC-2 type transport system ATP-binding protein